MQQPISRDKANILVVDDTPDNLRLLAAMLANQGYEVRKALNGKMALTACNMLLPDVILLDINMPDMDGFQVCQQLKKNQNTAEVPIIFISALDDILDKVKAFNAGGVDYITKPFNNAEVILRIENQINLRQLQLQIQQKNNLLEQTLKDLKFSQAQQIQNEKMIALGELVGGISHEINNPISFIYGNIEHIEEYVETLIKLLSLYQQEYPEPSLDIQTYRNKVEIEFITEDIKNAIAQMYRGSNRISSIVLALQNFSRFDEAQLKPVDIHDGIESTLLVLASRLQVEDSQQEINIVRNYGKLPPVECYVSELNQVFMHLISNAIDAVKGEFNRVKPYRQHLVNQPLIATPTIQISTQTTEHATVAIAIADNGVGIPSEAKSRIFNPFFSTKVVNQGRGLGLAISYQIITQKHHGTIICNSQVQIGTEFIIEIPIQQSVFN